MDYLQRAVANSYAMYLNYKKYHWNISGPLFRDVHLLFDEHAGHILETVDELRNIWFGRDNEMSSMWRRYFREISEEKSSDKWIPIIGGSSFLAASQSA